MTWAADSRQTAGRLRAALDAYRKLPPMPSAADPIRAEAEIVQEHGEASPGRDRRRNPASSSPNRDGQLRSDGQALDRRHDDSLGAGAGQQGLPAPLCLQDRRGTSRSPGLEGRSNHRKSGWSGPRSGQPTARRQRSHRPGRARTDLHDHASGSGSARVTGELPRSIGSERGRPPCRWCRFSRCGSGSSNTAAACRKRSRTWSLPACSTRCRPIPTSPEPPVRLRALLGPTASSARPVLARSEPATERKAACAPWRCLAALQRRPGPAATTRRRGMTRRKDGGDIIFPLAETHKKEPIA